MPSRSISPAGPMDPEARPRGSRRMAARTALGVIVLTLLTLLTLPTPSHALDLFTWRAEQVVRVGKGRPTVTVQPQADFKSLTLRVTRDDGTELVLGGKPAARGKAVVLTWDQPEGEAAYRGEIAGVYPNGEEYRVPVSFSVFVGEGLEMKVPREAIDLKAGRLEVTLTRPAGKVQITVLGPDGPIAEEAAEFDGEAPGTPLPVTWTPGGEVVRIDVVGYDKFGFYASEEISPWALDIPHEEVVFATGSHAIEATERPKLDRAWDRIAQAVARYGGLVKVQLFVAGYTDTVGDRGSNQILSESRARSIAGYFRQRGFAGPISYQGFGEDGLAVVTEDGTDEIRNRRAAYVLAAQVLPISAAIPRAAWRPLK